MSECKPMLVLCGKNKSKNNGRKNTVLCNTNLENVLSLVFADKQCCGSSEILSHQFRNIFTVPRILNDKKTIFFESEIAYITF